MLAAVRAHGEAAWPEEACGVVVQDAVGGQRALPGRNLLASPTRFELDPAVLFGVAARGERVLAFYHSHCDAPAVLSEADRRALLIGDAPAWPGVEHLIVSVRGGAAVDLRRFRWYPSARAFQLEPEE